MSAAAREPAPLELDSRRTALAPLGAAVCAHLRLAASRLGVDLGARPDWSEASFALQTDPYSGEQSLVGTWKDGARYGTITCFPDQRVFAEYQILAPHPTLAGQFIEAIHVWGTTDKLKSEPVLLALPD